MMVARQNIWQFHILVLALTFVVLVSTSRAEVAVIAHQQLNLINTQDPQQSSKQQAHMMTFTCNSNDVTQLSSLGQAYTFHCGNIKYNYMTELRTKVPFDTAMFTTKACYPLVGFGRRLYSESLKASSKLARGLVDDILNSSEQASFFNEEQIVRSRRKSSISYRVCDGADSIPLSGLFRSPCIDPATARELNQMYSLLDNQEEQVSQMQDVQQSQRNELIDIKKTAINNARMIEEKFNAFEANVAASASSFLNKLEKQANDALKEWQQESDDFVLWTNFRMKNILYEWASRLTYMRRALQDRISWTYDLTLNNVMKINNDFQRITNVMQRANVQHQGTQVMLNNMRSLIDKLIQTLIGFGHVAQQYYRLEEIAKELDYVPFLGHSGQPLLPPNQTIPIGSVMLDSKYEIVFACGQCPECPVDSTLHDFDCRIYYRSEQCPKEYVKCEQGNALGLVRVNNVSLLLFNPDPSQVFRGHITYQIPESTQEKLQRQMNEPATEESSMKKKRVSDVENDHNEIPGRSQKKRESNGNNASPGSSAMRQKDESDADATTSDGKISVFGSDDNSAAREAQLQADAEQLQADLGGTLGDLSADEDDDRLILNNNVNSNRTTHPGQRTLRFVNITQLLDLLSQRMKVQQATMQAFFGADPRYWRATLPEGLSVVEQPAQVFDGHPVAKCKEISFGAIRDHTIPFVPVRTMRLVNMQFEGNMIKPTSESSNEAPTAFFSAYAQDPYAHLLPTVEQDYIQERYTNDDIDIVIAPPFNLVNLNPNPQSRLGSVSYLFNSQGNFSYAANDIPNFDPIGLSVSPSIFIAPYDKSSPWCGASDLEVRDANPGVKAVGARGTTSGLNLCALSQYYDIEETLVPNSTDSILTFRPHRATLKFVYKKDMALDESAITMSCPTIDLFTKELECQSDLCLLNVHNPSATMTVFQVDVQNGCVGKNQTRSMTVTLDAYAQHRLQFQMCPGQPYNVTIYTKEFFSERVTDVCLTVEGIAPTRDITNVRAHVQTVLDAMNVTFQRELFAGFSDKKTRQVDSINQRIQQTMERLQMNTGKYTMNDVVKAFTFTVNTADLNQFINRRIDYEMLNLTYHINNRTTDYSKYFDKTRDLLQKNIDKETVYMKEFNENMSLLWKKSHDIMNAPPTAQSKGIEFFFNGIWVVVLVIICIAIYEYQKHKSRSIPFYNPDVHGPYHGGHAEFPNPEQLFKDAEERVRQEQILVRKKESENEEGALGKTPDSPIVVDGLSIEGERELGYANFYDVSTLPRFRGNTKFSHHYS